MAFTISEQIRQVRVPLEAPLYEILMQVTDKGDLNDGGVFVMSVTDSSDPKSDTLARVATIADLEMLGTSRASAVAAAVEDALVLYRSAQVTVRYESLTTAVAAKDVFKSRVDELVIDWQTYQSQFLADGAVHGTVLYPTDITEHPRYNQDAYSLFVKAYLTAIDNETTAKSGLTIAATTYNDAVTAADVAQVDVTDAKYFWDRCVLVGAKVNAFVVAADAYVAHSTPDSASYLTDYNAAHAALYTAPTPASFCGELEGTYNDAVTAKATADTAVATARTAYESAKAAYASAQAATNAALAAIRTLKPSFDPATDIPADL